MKYRIRYLKTKERDAIRAMGIARGLVRSNPHDTDLMDGFRSTVRAFARAHRTLHTARDKGTPSVRDSVQALATLLYGEHTHRSMVCTWYRNNR